ncbi:MAG TPA: DUF4386 domain-containing protein, partial [Propionibacteriaceae bacterium]
PPSSSRGVVCLLSVVSLRQAGAGADALVTSQALAASYEWAFLSGPGFMAAVNALLLGSLMYRSGLVPRIIPLAGLIGAPLLLAFRYRRYVRPVGAVLPAGGDRDSPGGLVGVLAGGLSGRQGLQALADHCRHDRFKHPARLPGRRLTVGS